MKLIFSNGKGAYLSDVRVELFDEKGRKVLAVVSNSPWLFVDLPSGLYSLEATHKGVKMEIPKFQIERGAQKVIHLRWDA